MKAKIVLEDGKDFEGRAFGCFGESYGEVVFNTSMTGYQEIITDPSYKGQIVVMTYPLIGNCGINDEDSESANPYLEGFVVKELSRTFSSWRAKMGLEEYFSKNNILAVEGIDTRALTRHIRLKGAMKAVISTDDLDNKSLLIKVKASKGLVGEDLVQYVSCKKRYNWNENGRFKVAVLDCGAKYNILRLLEANNCQVSVFPARSKADEILAHKPQGLLLSNGPGDPAALDYLIDTVRGIIGKIPVFGICLGHQILGLALGAKTYKLKFGHHGGNHPVKNLKTGRVYITAQNHGFCVDAESLKGKGVEFSHINLNDNTLEGFYHKRLGIFSVQFHPESSPGPREANILFREFIGMMERGHA